MGASHTGEPNVTVATTADETSETGAELIAATLTDAIGRRGRADWATTGGSTPTGIYRHLAGPPLRDGVDWSRVHLWWGDDRYVPHDHPLSNVLPAEQVLLGFAALAGQSGLGESAVDVTGGREPGAPIPAPNVHPFRIAEAIGKTRGAAWCAARYADALRDGGLETRDEWPVFDLVLLGIGGDGHILSVFPGSPAFDSSEWALAIPAPTHIEPHVERVTLNPRILDVAGTIVVVATGAAKADAIARALGDSGDPREVPARLAARPGATWLLDQAAASRLESPP
jgi:6-phosphogluconolactonase